VQSGQVEQGGSTITQQLVKKALLSDDRVLDRKTREAALAIRLEGQISKDEILELYLNTVYFGNGAYGVKAAAETYWGKSPADLTWVDSALLASLISNPVGNDPLLRPQKAKAERKLALERMVDNGVITRAQATEFDALPLPSGKCVGGGPKPAECGTVEQPPPDSYFVEAVKEQLLADPRIGGTYQERYAQVFGGGLRIYTTLDPAAQAAAQRAHDTTFPDNVRREADAKGITTAMVAVDNASGAVRAVVGGPGFDEFKYDIATHEPGRQTGSTFKTFVLLTALEQGVLPEDTVGGGGSWPNRGSTPDPYEIDGGGGTLMGVTASSSNGAFVRLGQTVGLANVVDLAQRLGVSSNFDPGAKAMPLGVFDVTPLEMASGYSVIPNGGVHNPPYYIDRVEDRTGRVLMEHTPDPARGVSWQTACLATEILANNVRSGTGTNAQLRGQSAAGKTGTTESNSNTWFVGFTPQLTTAVCGWASPPRAPNRWATSEAASSSVACGPPPSGATSIRRTSTPPISGGPSGRTVDRRRGHRDRRPVRPIPTECSTGPPNRWSIPRRWRRRPRRRPAGPRRRPHGRRPPPPAGVRAPRPPRGRRRRRSNLRPHRSTSERTVGVIGAGGGCDRVRAVGGDLQCE
ncbi:MAG: transglycosylase domain-containing protein, partial [Acidimicrobiia bacterium]